MVARQGLKAYQPELFAFCWTSSRQFICCGLARAILLGILLSIFKKRISKNSAHFFQRNPSAPANIRSLDFSLLCFWGDKPNLLLLGSLD